MTDVGKALAERRAGGNSRTGKTIVEFIDDEKFEFAKALPNGIAPDRFARLVLTECRKTPKLLQCSPASLLGAAMNAAQLGLEPGPLQHCYFVPRTNHGQWEVQFQLGYRGIIDLALRGGRTLMVDAHVVYEADAFDFAYGTERFLRHRPAPSERGAPTWVYANAELRDGGKPFMVLSIQEVERRRRRGQSPNSGAWVNDWAAMTRKTAVRALAPFLPQTPEFAMAVRLDDTVRTDYTSALEEYEPSEAIDAEGEEVPPPADGGAATASDGEAAPSSDDPTRPM